MASNDNDALRQRRAKVLGVDRARLRDRLAVYMAALDRYVAVGAIAPAEAHTLAGVEALLRGDLMDVAGGRLGDDGVQLEHAPVHYDNAAAHAWLAGFCSALDTCRQPHKEGQ
jgi:hypothetical protein